MRSWKDTVRGMKRRMRGRASTALRRALATAPIVSAAALGACTAGPAPCLPWDAGCAAGAFAERMLGAEAWDAASAQPIDCAPVRVDADGCWRVDLEPLDGGAGRSVVVVDVEGQLILQVSETRP